MVTSYSGSQKPHYITSKIHSPNIFLQTGVMQLLPMQTHCFPQTICNLIDITYEVLSYKTALRIAGFDLKKL